jgi:putative ABC transport system permease protein
MLSTRWRKVLRELWSNRSRTLLVIASIAVGIFAVGTVQHLRTVILTEMQAIYQASNAAQATLFTAGIDDETLVAIRREPNILDAQGSSSLTVKVLVAEDTWENLSIRAVDDFNDIRINLLEPLTSVDGRADFGAERGTWPADDQIMLERGGLTAAGALPEGLRVGDPLLLENDEGKQRTVTVSGAVYDANGFPAAFTGSGSGFVNVDTFQRLGGNRKFSQVNLRIDGTPEQLRDEDYIRAVAESIEDKLERGGIAVQRVQVPEPGQLPLQDLFDSLALLLTPLGLLALFLSGFLVINTISALMSQQVRQIGVMKAIGARRYQIVGMYLGAVLLYSVASLAVAIPLTIFVAGGLAAFLGGFINIDFPRWSLPTNVLIIQISVGILVPILAALFPVFRGTSVTVREAISDYGVGSGQGMGDGLITRILASLRGVSRPMQLSLRNTFRRKGRLVLTLITLVLGGMLFMTVGSVRASLNGLIETGLDYFQYDVQFTMGREYRAAQIEQVIETLPEAGIIESWGSASVLRIRDDGSESTPLTMTALPADSAMVKPTLSQGRWLLDDDANAIVLSQTVIAAEPDIQVGDTINLKINDKESPWVVVGIAQVLGGPPNVIPTYVNYPYYARLTGAVGRATSVQVKLRPDSDLTMDEAAAILTERLEAAGYDVASSFTIATLRRFTGAFFDIIVYLLLSMGVLIASVGALGLMGTMSTNVMERTREIGVMRAVGASDWSVQKIVIVEGIFIGWLSWMLGAMLAFPVGLLLATTVGNVLFQQALPYVFSSGGLITWFIIVTVLATLASYLPAWSASRLTVREVLAYQ